MFFLSGNHQRPPAPPPPKLPPKPPPKPPPPPPKPPPPNPPPPQPLRLPPLKLLNRDPHNSACKQPPPPPRLRDAEDTKTKITMMTNIPAHTLLALVCGR